MSEKNKILFVGAGLLVVAIALTTLFFFLGRMESTEETMPADNRNGALLPIDDTIHTRQGVIISVSAKDQNMTILSGDEEHFFVIDKAEITGLDESLKNVTNLTPGMQVEIVSQRGSASSIRVLFLPKISIIYPPASAVLNLQFNIEGIARNQTGRVCFTLSNRRTGVVYEENLSVPILPDGRFTIPVDLSIALDALPNDMLDSQFSICGEEEIVSLAWRYYAGLTSHIKVYFLKNSCSNLHSVMRVIPAYRSITRASIEELLKGPNTRESALGIFSITNPAERIRSVSVQEGMAYLDFYPSILRVSRCNVSALKTQISRTLGQFPQRNIVITVEGEKENPLN